MTEKTNTQIEICPKHGPYEVYDRTFSGRLQKSGYCKVCYRENQIADATNSAAERRQELIGKLLEMANISKRFAGKTFNDYEAKEPRQVAVLETIKRYAEEFEENLRQGRCMVWTGGPGVGKTLLACCLIESVINLSTVTSEYVERFRDYEFIEKGNFARYETEYSLLRAIKNTWNKNNNKTEDEVIDYYSNFELLIVDEMGMSFQSNTEKTLFYQIINGRYENNLPTILVSNFNLKDLTLYAGLRVMDRMRENGGFNLIFDWESHRK